MLAKIRSCTLLGIHGQMVDVEVDVQSRGLPAFDIVGLPDAAVREAKERVKASIENSGFEFPRHRIVVNMAPADLKKEGPGFDLPIAIGVLAATGQVSRLEYPDTLFSGELSLDGRLREVTGVLPMAITARDGGLTRLVVAAGNGEEGALVKQVSVYAFMTLGDVVDYLNAKTPFDAVSLSDIDLDGDLYAEDFADVRGQEGAKRAIEVAAAGGHNLLMIGSPGSGKTMLARRIPSVLPSMGFDEALEVTRIYSVSGMLAEKGSLVRQRPFRLPHHSVSNAGLIGGGSVPRPGEVSLAHNGVLFLDELPEFRKDVLELLRQPLEDGRVTIARATATLSYPSSVMLICAMNPCPCGYYQDPVKPCSCADHQIRRYLSRISGPLLDRIDIHIEVPRVEYNDLENQQPAERSSVIRARVQKARDRQLARLEGTSCHNNAQMSSKTIRQFCQLSKEAKDLLRAAFVRLGLSARAHDRILKVARTIADLSESDRIEAEHLAEAISYRSLDKKLWGH